MHCHWERQTEFPLRLGLGRIAKAFACKKMELAQVLILLCANTSPFWHDSQKIISEEESNNKHNLHNFKEKSFGLIPDIVSRMNTEDNI